MISRAKQQGPKTFCAMFRVAWDLTWLGCEGMKKNRHTCSEDGIQWPVLALLESTKYTTQSLIVFIMYSTEGVCTLGGVARRVLLVSHGSGALSPWHHCNHVNNAHPPRIHPPFLHSLKASLVPPSTAGIICFPFNPRLEREQGCLLYFCQLLTQ